MVVRRVGLVTRRVADSGGEYLANRLAGAVSCGLTWLAALQTVSDFAATIPVVGRTVFEGCWSDEVRSGRDHEKPVVFNRHLRRSAISASRQHQGTLCNLKSSL